ncbi:STAS domain-containing protein [Neobacillus sp. PS3-34]|uniref:STAS domain-containing protein n=1 Tax=Neobacillus sp. PS3-34 TaxID=3070678 RepID=UPI0027E1745A|nr:STAS domain-containing protein [Neobacillus sp. PS3-34]WML48925.1 STAS domain-containing protein [Neobacillus sp. PS3-34]
MEHGPFPHFANITLFKTYSANIVVDQLIGDDGERIGYILTWKDVTEYEKKIQETKKQIQELDTPIIPLALDTSILIPVLGTLSKDRLHFMEEKVLTYCSKHEIEFILFDFSGIADELNSEIAFHLQQIHEALVLMGVEPIYIGIGRNGPLYC